MGIMNCGDFFKKSSSLASVAFMKSPFRHASRLPAVRVGLRRPLVLGWRYAQRSAPSHRLRGVTDTTNGSLRWIAAAHLRANDYKLHECQGTSPWSCLCSSQYKLRPLPAQHFVRGHKAQVQADASIGNLDTLDRVGGHFMGDHYMSVCQGMSNQVVVGYLQEGIDGSRLILLLCGLGAYRSKLGGRSCSSLYE